MARGTESLNQQCHKFSIKNWASDTYHGPVNSYYACEIFGNLTNDQEEVTTDTSVNTVSNDEVTAVQYNSFETVKFIPNSLFKTFVNLEFLLVYYNNKFETMKPEYLRNATKLKNLKIYKNSVQIIDGHVFSEAVKLEHINFAYNQIKAIHKEAFSGLPNLKGIYLQGNKIKNLHALTFSSIANLNILELSRGENCVFKKFTSANEMLLEIEGIISSHCTYELFTDEVMTIQKLAEENKIQIQKANDKIDSLTADAQANQNKFKEMTNKLEQIKSEFSSQMETQLTAVLKQINDQKDWNQKYSKEIETTCRNDLQLVQTRLTVLERQVE